VAPVDPAISTKVSYCRKLGGRPYGPSRMTGKERSVLGEEVVGREAVARAYRRLLNPAWARTTKAREDVEDEDDAMVKG
jgi:hypothetical protein